MALPASGFGAVTRFASSRKRRFQIACSTRHLLRPCTASRTPLAALWPGSFQIAEHLSTACAMKPHNSSECPRTFVLKPALMCCFRYDNGYDMTAADLTKRYADLQQVSLVHPTLPRALMPVAGLHPARGQAPSRCDGSFDWLG